MELVFHIVWASELANRPVTSAIFLNKRINVITSNEVS
jgi:hypothetical protein